MNIKDMTTFEKFLTPSLITIVYWIGIVGISISSLGTILSSFSSFGGGLKQFIIGLIMFVVGIIFWRVICEGIMLAFKIYDRLTEIKHRLPR